MGLLCKHHSVIFLFVVSAFLGCHGETADDARVDDVEILPSLSGPDDPIDVRTVSARNSVHRGRLQLRQGDRKFYRRVIEQSLLEQPEIGFDRVWERVEVMLSLTVREANADAAWIDVAFHEVRYQHELGSHQIIYDSRSQSEIPPQALVYSGLKENGFSFKLDADNGIVDVRDFDIFLTRCLRSASLADHQRAILSLGERMETPRARTMAALSFLDESIALIPVGELSDRRVAESRIGAKWDRSSRRTFGVPVEEELELSLIHVSGEIAHFKLSGTIHPTEQRGQLSQEGIRSRILGGTLTGSCSIETPSGLPKSSSIQRVIHLEVDPIGEPPVRVKKSVVTTLEEVKLDFP